MSPDAHDVTHAPPEHTCPAAQARPHAPQWALSLWVSRHDPEHSVSPAVQLTTQLPAVQT